MDMLIGGYNDDGHWVFFLVDIFHLSHRDFCVMEIGDSTFMFAFVWLFSTVHFQYGANHFNRDCTYVLVCIFLAFPHCEFSKVILRC